MSPSLQLHISKQQRIIHHNDYNNNNNDNMINNDITTVSFQNIMFVFAA